VALTRSRVKDLKIEPLRQKIRGFLRSYGNDRNARLFNYYAGHGYSERILQRNEYRGYITGIDTPSVDGGQRAWDAARVYAMSMMEMRLHLAEALAKHILIVFDSCFAGTIFLAREGNAAPRELTPDVVARLMERSSRDIITAGRANERVPAHSPIPKLLLAVVNGAADLVKTRRDLGCRNQHLFAQSIAEFTGCQPDAAAGPTSGPKFC
jgi:hypothetical protein